eukprot:745317-Hanusia_phi.AAC.2
MADEECSAHVPASKDALHARDLLADARHVCLEVAGDKRNLHAQDRAVELEQLADEAKVSHKPHTDAMEEDDGRSPSPLQ